MERFSKVINLTPHRIDIVNSDGVIVFSIPPSSSSLPARLPETEEIVGTVSVNGIDIPIVRKSWGSIELPEPQEGTLFIVSNIVKQAFPHRSDLITPVTVRDSNGQIVGCVKFQI